MATSSALQLGDIAIVWSGTSADLAVIDDDLASDNGLVTAVLLSLFLDRRAEDDDVPPSGDPNDRRGWWADELADIEGDRIGSRLWLLDRAKRTGEDARRAEEYVREALAWMIEDSAVSTVDVVVEHTARDRLIAVTLHRPDREALSFRFSHTWSALAA